MLVMSYILPEIGTVKLTIGVRQKNEAERPMRVEYGVSVLPEGMTIDDDIAETIKKKKRKKHPTRSEMLILPQMAWRPLL